MRLPRLILTLCAALVLWLSCTRSAGAQPLPGLYAPGALPMRTYDTSAHPGSADNWSIATGPEGRVFVGNGAGVFALRGAHVSSLIRLANRSAVRSVAAGPNGVMYVGGTNELGYLVPASDGTLRYISLLEELPEAQRTFHDVWTIKAHGASVYFYTYRQLMRWTPATGAMKVWQFDEVTVLVESGGGPVLQRMGQGVLQRLVGDTWQAFLQAPEVLTKEPARLLAPHPSGGSILVTGRALYRVRGGRLERQPSPLDSGERRRWVYDAAVLPGGYLALGTLYEGVLFVDPDGALVRRLSKSDGLPDNVVLTLLYDGRGHLWIGLERGLVRADLGSGVSYIGKRDGLQADALTLAPHAGTLYVGGVEQLARVDGLPHMPMRQVAAPADDVLDLLSTPQGLLVGLAGGLRVSREGRMETVPGFSIEGDYPATLLRSTVDTNRVYVGFRRGLAMLRLQANRWVFDGVVEGVGGHVTSMAEAADGTLWLGTPHEDLWHVALSGRAPRVTRYGPAEGLPRIAVAPLRVGNRVVFYSSQGFYRQQGARIVPDSSALAAMFDYAPHTLTSARVTPEGDVYLIADGEVGVARREGDQYRWERVADEMVQRAGATALWVFGNDLWLARAGLLVHARTARPTTAPTPFNAYVTSIRTVGTDSLVYGGFGPLPALQLDANKGVTFTVSTPRYDGAQFRFWLEGAEEGWSPWTSTLERSYLTLPAGTYTLRVQAVDRYGNLSEETAYGFTMVPPWYLSRPMQTVYVVLVLLFVLLCAVTAAHWQEKRSEAARRLLKAKVRVHTREAEAQKRMLRYLNKTLQESNARLEELSTQKSRLLSIAAHDLKSPIANIYSLAEIVLEERDEGPPNYEFIELIRASARQMSTLIDDVLNSEARESGQLQLHPVRTNLHALASRAVQQCTVPAERKGQSVRLHVVPPGASFETKGDETRIVEAMTNLLSNAVKYSPLGSSIEVHMARTAEAFRFEVRDQGPGLREEDRAGLFQPFQRLSAQPTGGESSSGMGLYIVRQYVEMHGGQVGVESYAGAGSIFWFTLPLPGSPAAAAARLVDVGSESPA